VHSSFGGKLFSRARLSGDMEKDFDQWNEKKKIVNQASVSKVFFREREIWWCRLGANVGYEQDGKGNWFKRPILILRKFNEFAFSGVPLSTSNKNDEYHYQFTFSENIKSTALISQVKFIDSKRLDVKMGFCSEVDFKNMRKAVRDLYP
jgi:mRNA interferase MazF